jgi:hypothetical protein
MHFAVGMVGGAAVTAAAALVCRRGLRFTPLGMTAGGLWAIVPDTPRLVRIDFPSLRALPGAHAFAAPTTEAWLHAIGDLFFFHRTLDRHAGDLALAGLFGTIAGYTLGLAALLGVIAWQRARIRRLQQQLRSHRPVAAAPPDRRRNPPDAVPDGPPGQAVPRRRRTDWQHAG